MTKIALLGAGSTVFARQLPTDIMLVDGLDEGTFALVDIDPERLDLTRRIAEQLVRRSGKNWQVSATAERRDVLSGCDFLINTIEVAGLASVRHDFDIPMKYGVSQCIGDTIGPGGIFYASYIIEAIVKDRPATIYGNVRNTGLIDNLPDGCVEVKCLVDRDGIQPCHFGALPEQLAGLNRSHMTVHNLVSEALLTRNREAARYALMLDPLAAAVCSPAEISGMFDEMWDAECDYLQGFA